MSGIRRPRPASASAGTSTWSPVVRLKTRIDGLMFDSGRPVSCGRRCAPRRGEHRDPVGSPTPLSRICSPTVGLIDFISRVVEHRLARQDVDDEQVVRWSGRSWSSRRPRRHHRRSNACWPHRRGSRHTRSTRERQTARSRRDNERRHHSPRRSAADRHDDASPDGNLRVPLSHLSEHLHQILRASSRVACGTRQPGRGPRSPARGRDPSRCDRSARNG